MVCVASVLKECRNFVESVLKVCVFRRCVSEVPPIIHYFFSVAFVCYHH